MDLFGPDQLKKIIDGTLAAEVPAGHNNAIVGTVDINGAQLLVSFKLKDSRWKAQGVIRHDWSGGNTAAASLVYSWPTS